MQYYTTQQLQGHTTFKPTVRIGNWNEDIELMNEKQKEINRAKELGMLPHQIIERKMNHHNQPISLTQKRGDRQIWFGDVVMLRNVATEGVLSMDLDTQVHHLHDRYACSSALNISPCARNCFVIEKIENDVGLDIIIPEDEGHVLHYGQKFRLRCVSEFSKPLYLRTEKASPTCFAEGTSSAEKCQEVSVDQLKNFDAAWKFQFVNKAYRMEAEGTPVLVDDPVVVTHCLTNQNLSSTKEIPVSNDFGREYQIFCKSTFTIHKTETPSNHFVILQGN